jgi:hypothetical protein
MIPAGIIIVIAALLGPAIRPVTIVDLGHPLYSVRERATLGLELRAWADPPSESRLVEAARFHRDPEVRSRAQAILRRLHRCPDCHGSRLQCQAPAYDGGPVWCKRCRGIGSDWFAGFVCAACNGTGYFAHGSGNTLPGDWPCGECRGTGEESRR